jgi:hypothetical protein
VVVMLVLASGWSQITTEARGYKLWIPQHTSIMRSRHWHAGLFPQHDELTVLVTAKDGVANVLRPEVVRMVSCSPPLRGVTRSYLTSAQPMGTHPTDGEGADAV